MSSTCPSEPKSNTMAEKDQNNIQQEVTMPAGVAVTAAGPISYSSQDTEADIDLEYESLTKDEVGTGTSECDNY